MCVKKIFHLKKCWKNLNETSANLNQHLFLNFFTSQVPSE